MTVRQMREVILMYIGIAIAVIVLILGILLVRQYRIRQEEKRQEEERQRKIAEEEERQRQIRLKEEEKRAARRAETEAGKELYRYLNQSIKTMFYHYRTETWQDLTELGRPELSDRQAAVRCIAKLPSSGGRMVRRLFSCLDIGKELEGEGKVTDSRRLKDFFLQTMMPFFPVYYREFSGGPRYISFLNQRILKLFTQLSGKKFRLGYKNRYPNGQIAFEWSDDLYRVYRSDGTRLCEATFADGGVKDGYAMIREYEDDQWEVYRSGCWKDGVLVKEDTRYRYKVKVEQISPAAESGE